MSRNNHEIWENTAHLFWRQQGQRRMRISLHFFPKIAFIGEVLYLHHMKDNEIPSIHLWILLNSWKSHPLRLLQLSEISKTPLRDISEQKGPG
jgi:hypothetical protein